MNQEVLEQEKPIESCSIETWNRPRDDQKNERLSRERARRRKEAKKPLYLMRYE